MGILKSFFLLSFCVGLISCYDYSQNIDEIIQNIDQQLEMYASSTLMNFYNYQAQSVEMQFQMLASTVAQGENPYAKEHVIIFRNNYTAVPFLLDNMINETRDAIIETFDQQRQGLASVIPQVRTTSDDVYVILTQKGCNETIIEEFYMDLLYMTSQRVTMSISEGYSAYMHQLMNQYAPFMLFNSFIMQLQMCAYNSFMLPLSETRECMVQKDDMYLSTTITLIWESLKSVEGLIKNFNMKITLNVVKDVETTFDRAYKNALLTQC